MLSEVQALVCLLAVPNVVASLSDLACLAILAAMLDAFAFAAVWVLAKA